MGVEWSLTAKCTCCYLTRLYSESAKIFTIALHTSHLSHYQSVKQLYQDLFILVLVRKIDIIILKYQTES